MYITVKWYPDYIRLSVLAVHVTQVLSVVGYLIIIVRAQCRIEST